MLAGNLSKRCQELWSTLHTNVRSCSLVSWVIPISLDCFWLGFTFPAFCASFSHTCLLLLLLWKSASWCSFTNLDQLVLRIALEIYPCTENWLSGSAFVVHRIVWSMQYTERMWLDLSAAETACQLDMESFSSYYKQWNSEAFFPQVWGISHHKVLALKLLFQQTHSLHSEI